MDYCAPFGGARSVSEGEACPILDRFFPRAMGIKPNFDLSPMPDTLCPMPHAQFPNLKPKIGFS
ncbi:hypothetical protein [Tolypothrix sp. VBCCA 56010]|uniref:hypothetical protein n=1 Tax=Tolypothrix sp. VBCCA 56010 TaxID=3137731 RepID=UPI003D7D6DA7